MRFLGQYRFALIFVVLLVFSSVMVIRQINLNQSKHVEVREAFILLHTRGYTNQAERVYNRLLRDVDSLSNKALLDDFQRTVLLVDPAIPQPENLIWKYHWVVSNELDRRSHSALMRALKIAEQDE